MELRYLSRSDYRLKEKSEFLQSLLDNEKDYYLIPEGGTNELAVKGCEEILINLSIDFDYVCCACGTGGTISGIINSLKSHQRAIGFPALKGAGFLKEEIEKYVYNPQWELNLDYHFGGYAKVKPELINFMNSFKTKHQIPLDPIYTGKMLFGLWNLIEKDYFRAGSTIVAVHTGGLQGIDGMNDRLKNKGLQIL
jgi:1-aminocyclopropane-1-carboxylate deaminase